MIEPNGLRQQQLPQQLFNQASLDDGVDLDFLIAAVQRQWKVVAASAAIGLVLGVAYLLSATPLYTSSTRILYDQTQGKVVDELTDISGVFGDQSEFESQLELIKSERIANKVVDSLKLHLNDQFLDEGQSGIGAIITTVKSAFDVMRWFSDAELTQAEIDDRKRAAAEILKDNVSASRIKRTYIIQLSYRSESPQRARQIAQSFAKSYLDDQLDSKYDATRRASEWLQTRIAELKDQSLQADLAVQRFKAENELVDAGGTGQNLAEARLSGANAQLIVAKGKVAERKAQYDKLNAAIEAGDLSVAVDASLDSQIITSMREKYLDLSKQQAEFSAKLGAKHIKVINLRSEMAEYQRLMFEELRRIRDSSKGEYEIAIEQEKTLRANLAQMVSETASTNKVQVKLRELEREAATYKALLENFLQKYQESIQQQSFPVNDARIIEQAKVPGGPSHPRKGMSLAVALIFGGMIGTGIGAFREFRERFFRTGDQIRDILNLEFLGLIPKILPDNSWATRQSKAEDMNVQAVRHSNGISNYVVKQPLSSFAEALRGAKVAADISLETKKGKVLGTISCLPGEGKSTVSSNLAQLLAMQGSSTLLIDGDMRNPGLTRAIARHAKYGLVDVLLGDASLEEAVMYDPEQPQLHILPAVIKTRISHTSDLLTSQHMLKLLSNAKERFDYIIVDLPPVAPVVDVKAFASRIDAFILVVEWGKTSRSLVKSIMDSNPFIREKALGVVLNKAEMDQMKLYRAYGSSDYYYSQYSSYYRDDNNIAKIQKTGT